MIVVWKLKIRKKIYYKSVQIVIFTTATIVGDDHFADIAKSRSHAMLEHPTKIVKIHVCTSINYRKGWIGEKIID